MNDSLKEIIKEVIKDFFIITVAMLFVVSLANSIALIEYYPPYFPWVVMGTGAVTSIPTLLFYFKEEPTKLQARIRIVIHFCNDYRRVSADISFQLHYTDKHGKIN